MRDIVQAAADLSPRFDILTSIPGVSATIAFALLVEMPELGSLGAGEAASLAGLRPSPGNRADGQVAHSFAEAAQAFEEPSKCRVSSQGGSIRT